MQTEPTNKITNEQKDKALVTCFKTQGYTVFVLI